MSKVSEALYVWWLDELNTKALFGRNERILPSIKQFLPEYLVKELRSRFGRGGRRRLWVPDHLPDGVFAAPNGDRKAEWPSFISDECGGIVFEANELPKVLALSGFVTDLWLRPISKVAPE